MLKTWHKRADENTFYFCSDQLRPQLPTINTSVKTFYIQIVLKKVGGGGPNDPRYYTDEVTCLVCDVRCSEMERT